MDMITASSDRSLAHGPPGRKGRYRRLFGTAPLVVLPEQALACARHQVRRVAVMEFHCSTHQPPKPLDPAVDPAYQDGLPPRPRHANHAGEITIDWPVVHIPAVLQHMHTISNEQQVEDP